MSAGRQVVLSCVALVMALFALEGRARADGASGRSPARSTPEEHVNLWHSYRGDEEKALVELARSYERTHPQVVVDLLAIPFEAYSAKLQAAVPHAHGPDLYIEAHERLEVYRRDGLVAPIGAGFPDEDAASYDATAVRALTLDGVRYGVPLSSKCLALFVNEALLPKTPATIEEIAAMKASLPAGTYPIVYDSTTAFFHAPFLHAFGGRMIAADGSFAFFGEEAARSLEFVRGLAQEHAVPEEPSSALVAQLFATGHAATAIEGPWLVGDLKSGVKFRVEPLPLVGASGAKMRPFLTVEAVVTTPQGAQKPAALALARWMGQDVESSLVRATVGHQVVTLQAAWAKMGAGADPVLKAFHDAAADAIPMPTSTALRAAWVPSNQAILKVLRGEMSAKDALDEAKHRFEDVTRPLPPQASPAPLLLLLGLLLLAGAALGVRRARTTPWRAELKKSMPAYRYVAHAVLAVVLLVVMPLAAGAATSLFAGPHDHMRYVGLANYVGILTARGGSLLAHGSFYMTLLVTVAWTAVNVALHLSIGLALGIALSRPMMRMRAAYRVLLILPWAVPSYVTALAWKGMFHRQFGAVNAILRALGAEPVSWFAHFSTAFAANVATNTWLGFPFMMVVVLGALTSIPKDVLEAAEVDGATRWQRFRLVTLPLLGPTLLPAVVLGAVWTFNMFNVVFLVSGGDPDETTDILVSEAYRWAFTRDAQYGYAAAYAVLIFLLLAGSARVFGKRMSGPGAEAIA
jgi:arabinogalactan oligomer/maltooligosaccharide transport system permease protein